MWNVMPLLLVSLLFAVNRIYQMLKQLQFKLCLLYVTLLAVGTALNVILLLRIPYPTLFTLLGRLLEPLARLF